jgi:hypothetical protein
MSGVRIIGRSADGRAIVTVDPDAPPTLTIESPPGFVGCLRCHQLVSVEGVWYGGEQGGLFDVAAHVCRGETRSAHRLVGGAYERQWHPADRSITYVGYLDEREMSEMDAAVARGVDSAAAELGARLRTAGFAGPFTMPPGKP